MERKITLPCNFGDTVYAIESYCIDCIENDDYCHRTCKNPRYRLEEIKVDHFKIKENKIEICGFVDNYGVLGEDVFLNKSDAENALENKNKEDERK